MTISTKSYRFTQGIATCLDDNCRKTRDLSSVQSIEIWVKSECDNVETLRAMYLCMNSATCFDNRASYAVRKSLGVSIKDLQCT